jgi:hypothetical protein
VPNFFVTFTVPDALRPIVQRNPVHLFTLMFDAASRTLSELGAERLGQLAFSLVLHTWSRQLIFHPHLHAVVAAGGVAEVVERGPRPDFLFRGPRAHVFASTCCRACIVFTTRTRSGSPGRSPRWRPRSPSAR